MSKNGPRLSRLGVLAPAALSVCMDASVLAVPAAGAIVSTVLKELSKAFMLKKWFHGVMSAKEAESLIMEKGKNGSFLVRESHAHPGEYVLSVRVTGRVSHVMIRRQHGKYDVGSGEVFEDLVGLIEHFRSYPMMETSGDVLRLLQPVGGGRLRHVAATQRANDKEAVERPSSNVNYDGEFLALKALDESIAFTTTEGMKLENIMKNRYRNILPYDQTRVILQGREGVGDYINANYVRSSRHWDYTSSVQSSNESLNSVKSLFAISETKKSVPLVTKSLSDDALREAKKWSKLDRINGNIANDAVDDKIYIAAQGCLRNTTDDFWRMLWQQDVRVIAMITNEIEKDKRKCVRYWPAQGQEERYAGLVVRAVSETPREGYLAREWRVTDEAGLERTLHHYQYTDWADHGAPGEPRVLLSFMNDVNRRMAAVARSHNPPLQNILCVHCSAGVGRTGTYIVLDMLIDDLKHCGGADVLKAVAATRAQRPGMVQNKTQYRFIYRALQDYLDTNVNHKKDWADHGAPGEPRVLLSFMNDVNRRMAAVARSHNPPLQNILCVHCSAGVGRTGTYIVLDMLIDDLKHCGGADVLKAVAATRAQRPGMVQNKTQYRFIYRALQDYLDTNVNHKKVYTIDA